uniref:Uncharacterized protein n=1 Tax=viral metagenome TaxID=1070528 RepID=A0A6C0IXG8_9ZZZZ
MYSLIKNPQTNRYVSIYGELGQKILNNYIIHLNMSGGRRSKAIRKQQFRKQQEFVKKFLTDIFTDKNIFISNLVIKYFIDEKIDVNILKLSNNEIVNFINKIKETNQKIEWNIKNDDGINKLNYLYYKHPEKIKDLLKLIKNEATNCGGIKGLFIKTMELTGIESKINGKLILECIKHYDSNNEREQRVNDYKKKIIDKYIFNNVKDPNDKNEIRDLTEVAKTMFENIIKPKDINFYEFGALLRDNLKPYYNDLIDDKPYSCPINQKSKYITKINSNYLELNTPNLSIFYFDNLIKTDTFNLFKPEEVKRFCSKNYSINFGLATIGINKAFIKDIEIAISKLTSDSEEQNNFYESCINDLKLAIGFTINEFKVDESELYHTLYGIGPIGKEYIKYIENNKISAAHTGTHTLTFSIIDNKMHILQSWMEEYSLYTRTVSIEDFLNDFNKINLQIHENISNNLPNIFTNIEDLFFKLFGKNPSKKSPLPNIVKSNNHQCKSILKVFKDYSTNILTINGSISNLNQEQIKYIYNIYSSYQNIDLNNLAKVLIDNCDNGFEHILLKLYSKKDNLKEINKLIIPMGFEEVSIEEFQQNNNNSEIEFWVSKRLEKF